MVHGAESGGLAHGCGVGLAVGEDAVGVWDGVRFGEGEGVCCAGCAVLDAVQQADEGLVGFGDGGEAGGDGELGDVVFDEDGVLVVAWTTGEEGDDESFQVGELREEGAFVEGELVVVVAGLAVLFEQLHAARVVDLGCLVVLARDFEYRQQQAGR